MNRTVICIAGAHRSGTSMLARLLHEAGLYLGPEEDLMAPAADNPDGFWENLRFLKLNDEILNAFGGSWDLPPSEESKFDQKQLTPIRTKAQLLIESFSLKFPWGWKDPRNCLTLPFWQSLLPPLRTVIIVRNPLEAAYSMHRRNGNSYAFGLRLWEIYNRQLIRHTQPEERIITHYQFFFDHPEAELSRIAQFAELSKAEIGAAVRLVAQDRRHTSFSMVELVDAGASAEIIALYQSMIEEASIQGAVDNRSESRQPGPQRKNQRKAAPSTLDRKDPLAGTPSRLNINIPDGETVRRDLAAALRRAENEIGRRDGRIAEMEATIVRIDHMLQREQAQHRDAHAADQVKLESFAQQLRTAAEQRTRDAAELQKMRDRFVQTNHLLHNTSINLSSLEALNNTLSEQLRRQLQATKKLLRLLDEAKRAAERLRHSRRWKTANPFAWLASLFTGRTTPGFGHLDKVVHAYHQWRTNHPEAENLDDALQALTSRAALSPLVLPSTESDPARRVEPPAPLKPIEFRSHDEVEASIVIPVFNHFHFTQACLASVQENHDGIRFEVIVVDDCSTDATAELIAKIPAVVYLRNESNVGFIASCNRGAQTARGDYLLFLNNDTIVTPGWLAALRETFELERHAGIVGSKLVFPDGRLQEAGGIIWRDATGWNRGKFQDAEKPEYNFLREVDYCSAASLMIPKSLFESLGGFDSKYAPAYYEDTDLAFRVRDAGYKVLYQPLSKVIHYEGASGGTDISVGVKKHQEINRVTFAATWADVLAEKPPNGDLLASEALKPGQKRILVIDHHLPMPDRDSGSLRMFQILSILHRIGHRVTFLPDNLADIPPYADELRKRGIEVVHHPYVKKVHEFLETHGGEFDVVILSRCDFACKHIATVRQYAPHSRVIFDTVDLHFLREEREAELMQDLELKQQAAEKRQLEYELIDQADETWVVSPVEQKLLRAERPGKSIEVVSNIVDVPGSATPFSLRSDILFIGGFQHTPNIDAVLFFTREIFPRVRKQLPMTKFYIIGDKAPPEVIALADEDIVIAGYQPDVTPFFDYIKLSVAPLRFGAGVKGKINQSMGYGVPVVATSIAAEGISLANDEEIMIADEPGAFAASVVKLYQSEELWTRLSRNGLAQAKKLFSIEAARQELARIFSEAVGELSPSHLRSREAMITASGATEPGQTALMP